MENENELTLQESLNNLRKDLNLLVESQASNALLLRARYDALTKTGFTKKKHWRL